MKSRNSSVTGTKQRTASVILIFRNMPRLFNSNLQKYISFLRHPRFLLAKIAGTGITLGIRFTDYRTRIIEMAKYDSTIFGEARSETADRRSGRTERIIRNESSADFLSAVSQPVRQTFYLQSGNCLGSRDRPSELRRLRQTAERASSRSPSDSAGCSRLPFSVRTTGHELIRSSDRAF